jgi:hypothetical protein
MPKTPRNADHQGSCCRPEAQICRELCNRNHLLRNPVGQYNRIAMRSSIQASGIPETWIPPLQCVTAAKWHGKRGLYVYDPELKLLKGLWNSTIRMNRVNLATCPALPLQPQGVLYLYFSLVCWPGMRRPTFNPDSVHLYI